VEDVTPQSIGQYQQARADRVSSRTVNIAVGTLKTMLSWAEQTERIAENPIRHVRMLRKDPVKVRRALSEEEITDLLDASSPAYRLLWRTFLETGLRRGELAALRWTDLDLDGDCGMMHVRAEVTKTRRARTIPITGSLLTELRALKERTMWHGQNTRPWVFLNRRGKPWGHGSMLHGFQHCLARAGIGREGLDVHALRHTFATRLRRQGVDTKTIQDLLGHATWQMTESVYLHTSESERREAVERLSKLAEKACSGQSDLEREPDGAHSEQRADGSNA
jgi:integrase